MSLTNIEMSGKVCLITGASSGLGQATALGLAKLGATVVMVCRDLDKGARVKSGIIAESGNEAIEIMPADLSSLASVRHLATTFQATYPRLDVLINNAGVIKSRRTVTADGLEATFTINHLSHFLLTTLLLDTLKASAPARIINVSSSHHKAGKMNFDDLQGAKKYSMGAIYCQSKLANVLFTYELDRRLQGTGVTANCLHPGAIRSNFSDGLSGLWVVLWKLSNPLRKPPTQAAETPLYLATSPEVTPISGQYFIDKKPVASSEASYNEADAERLWQMSTDLTKQLNTTPPTTTG